MIDSNVTTKSLKKRLGAIWVSNVFTKNLERDAYENYEWRSYQVKVGRRVLDFCDELENFVPGAERYKKFRIAILPGDGSVNVCYNYAEAELYCYGDHIPNQAADLMREIRYAMEAWKNAEIAKAKKVVHKSIGRLLDLDIADNAQIPLVIKAIEVMDKSKVKKRKKQQKPAPWPTRDWSMW